MTPLTFAQFLREDTGGPTPGNVDGAFTVAGVAFDNERGLGATPDGGNVAYMGAVAMMRPSVFRRLARGGEDRSQSAAQLEALIRDGRPIAAPFLHIDYADDADPADPGEVRVTGHEGRARSDAFRAVAGDVPMPVQLLPRGGRRARHLTPAFFAALERDGLTPEGGGAPVRPEADVYLWAGQRVEL